MNQRSSRLGVPRDVLRCCAYLSQVLQSLLVLALAVLTDVAFFLR
jgi:hypothetical protein